jgi:hypothetical protein
VINSAITSRVSDVHIEPREKGVLVRDRLDGILKEVMDLPKWVHEGLVARMKITGGMDIAEKRIPQDGRIRVNTDEGCGKCGRSLQPGWAFCPYCASNTVSKASRKLQARKQRELPAGNVTKFKNQNR